MNNPQVKFRVAQINHIIGLINDFLNPGKGDWDWSRGILNRYPELDKKLKNIKNKSKRKGITRAFFKKFIINNKILLERRARLFQKEWDKINDKIMNALSEILEIKWPKKDKQIRAFVSPNPICPRYIKERTFDVYFLSSIKEMRATAVHEILHFLYFEKWKQVYPKSNEKHFDAPYLIWELSEMVPKTILSDKRLQKRLRHNPNVYKEYKNLKIKGRPLLSYINNFYSKRKDFEDFLRKSWTFVRKHEKEIQKA